MMARSERLGETWVTASATMVASFATLPLFLTGGLAVLIREDLDFGVSAVGFAGVVFVAFSAVAAIPGGKLVERIGVRRAIYIAGIMLAVCMLGIAGLAGSWLTLAAFLALGGTASGIAQPATNALIAHGISRKRQGLAFGVRRSSFSLGEVLAGLAVPLIAVSMGWRQAWMIAAIGLAISTLSVPKLTAHGPINLRRGRGRRPVQGPLWTLAIAGGFAIGAIGAIQIYFVEVSVARGLSISTAGSLLAIGGGVGVAARLVVGWFQDRRGGDVFASTVFLLGLGAVGFLVAGLSSGLPLAVVGTALAFGAGQGWTGLYMLGVVRLNPDDPGAATGRIEAGMSTGGVIGPIVFGFLVAGGSVTAAWLTGGASLVLAAVMVIGAKRSIAENVSA